MDPWVWWVIAAIVLGIVEVATGVTFVAMMLAVGALAGAGTAAVTGSDWLPWVVFAVTSTTMLVFARPVAHRLPGPHCRSPGGGGADEGARQGQAGA